MENVSQRYDRNEFLEVNAANYTVTEWERASCLHVIFTAVGGAVTITINTAWIARAGNRITIKDTGMNSHVNNITIETQGAELIEGEANALIPIDGASLTLQSDGTDLWVI